VIFSQPVEVGVIPVVVKLKENILYKLSKSKLNHKY